MHRHTQRKAPKLARNSPPVVYHTAKERRRELAISAFAVIAVGIAYGWISAGMPLRW